MKQTVLWQPNDGAQTEVLTRTEYEILYGGRRGGGKTDGGMAWLLYDKDHPRYRALVIRKNADDLNDWCDRAKRLYEPLGAVATGMPADYVFPSGAIIRTGHLKDANAFSKYQGHEYHKILIEELTQIPRERDYEMLISSCRSTIPELQPQVFSTCNPDGVGFEWVKNRWKLSGIPHKPVFTEVVDAETQRHLDRIFVPAGLADNPHLDKDPIYRAFLNSLPDGLREAWRDGSWDEPVIAGAYYTLELLQAQREGRIRYIPHDPQLKVHLVWDLGIDDSMTIGFWQRTSTDLRLIDYYENEGQGMQHYWDILEKKRNNKHYVYGTHFVPHDANKRELISGQTVADSMAGMGMKPVFIIPRGDIQMGILQARLVFPFMFINNTGDCSRVINAWRNYRKVWDEKLLKFKDDPLHDWSSHASDMLRMTAMIYKEMNNASIAPSYEVKKGSLADLNIRKPIGSSMQRLS